MAISVLIGLMLSWQAQVPTLFTPEKIGEGPYRAFSQPTSVTIQSIYPANRGEKVERQFGLMPLRFVGKPHPVNPRFVQDLIANLSHPYRVLEPNCVFHPDHHVVFKNGTDVVEVISCFTCDEVMVVVNQQYVDRVSMGPPKKLRTIFTSSMPLSDTLRASSEEWLTRELVNSFSTANTGTLSIATYPSGKIPTDESRIKSSLSKKLSKAELQVLFDILEVHCFNNRLTFKFTQPDLKTLNPPHAYVQLGGKEKASLIFYAGYSRAQLFLNGKFSRTIDLFGMEDRLQSFFLPKLSSK